ncbi:MAG: mechanosensitive ion channel protein MscS [Hymenobacteraceae bacterium]|nr:mechanosensitive ion channel protein MscS [Hymenobacteraceae bacterium]MDX5480653.1 mechanosensitive ion channel protein MscS [Hymenobacteraceae bacterium]
MLKNLLYAILLGTGMAACLSQQDNENTEAAETTAAETTTTDAAPEEEAPAPDPANFVVAKGRVGSIAVGEPIEEMRQNTPAGFSIADTTLMQEGQQYTAYLLHPQNTGKGVLVEQQCTPECQVWRIQVQHPDFKTPKGIGVGSKFSEVQQNYAITNVTFEEGNLVAIARDAGMSFMLDASQIPAAQLPRLNAGTVPANTLVESILVY